MKAQAEDDSDDDKEGAEPQTQAEQVFRENEKKYRQKEMELVQNIDNIGQNLA